LSGQHEEDDYEDMMTPTDDEGITSMNHTQKIPISMIKAKDKASVSGQLYFIYFQIESLFELSFFRCLEIVPAHPTALLGKLKHSREG
jgi:hypothetical protein